MSFLNINLENLSELKSRRGNATTGVIATILGLGWPVTEAYSIYLWVDSSTVTPDDVEVVASTLGDPDVGRWHRIDMATPPQVNSDWSATTGPAAILNKPSLGTAAALNVPAVGNASITEVVYGTDTRLNDARTPISHMHTVGQIADSTDIGRSLMLAVDAADARSAIAAVNTAGARSAISLTTTGSGAATYNSGTGALNIPTPSTSSGTVTSITAGTGLSGGTITTSGTISMPNVGTPDTYSGVATDVQGRVIAGTKRAYNNNVARPLNSNYTISGGRDTLVSYSVNAAWTLQALLSGNGTAFLEYSTDGGTNWIIVNQTGKVLNLLTFAGSDDMNLAGEIPANALVRIRTTSSNMTISYVRGQEVLQ